jgi:hypothetical protein
MQRLPDLVARRRRCNFKSRGTVPLSEIRRDDTGLGVFVAGGNKAGTMGHVNCGTEWAW